VSGGAPAAGHDDDFDMFAQSRQSFDQSRDNLGYVDMVYCNLDIRDNLGYVDMVYCNLDIRDNLG